MDFVSADRSRDSEFLSGLKDYNFGVAEVNRQITKDINLDRDTERQQLNDINTGELFTQIKDATGTASGVASATATFKNFQDYGAKIEKGIKNAQKVASDTAQKIQQVQATTEVPPPVFGGEAVPKGGLPKSKPTLAQIRQAREGASVEGGLSEKAQSSFLEESGAVMRGDPTSGGGPLSKASEVDKLSEAGEQTVKAGNLGEETGSLVGKVGTKALKGVGVLGSVAGLGMAIASDTHGGFARMSTADKLGNVAEIGGAGLDIIGVGLEATGFGVPFGLALQGVGTLLQMGSGIEGEISSKEQVPEQQKEVKQEEQEKEAQEQPMEQAVQGVSEAQAGGLGVARQQQN